MNDPKQKPTTLLYLLESFRGGLPSHASIGLTIGFIFCFLWIVEHTLRYVLVSNQHLHPLLEDETKRNILARHIGVDTLSCFVVAFFGWKARYILQEVWDTLRRKRLTETVIARKKPPQQPLSEAYDNRLFRYHPEAARIMVFFAAFQFKNLADTITWNDGPEFIAHHVLAIFSAGGGLIPGACHFYGVFYFGISELSTGILCVLINFDDEHGVVGLAAAFPLLRAVLGGLFAVSFVIIRVFLWGTVTYHYFQDVWQAYQDNHPKMTSARRLFFFFNNISLGFITLLQVVWLFEILRMASVELEAMGVLK